MLVASGGLILVCALLGWNAVNEGMSVRQEDPQTSSRRAALPGVFTRLTPGGIALFSRAARGSWNVDGPADRIDLPNGRRYYLANFPPDVSQASLAGRVETSTPIWPDTAWYVEAGPNPYSVVAITRDGRRWVYGLAGSW